MIAGGLFTRDFLMEGVTGTDAWMSCRGPQFGDVTNLIEASIAALAKRKNPNEAETEADLVYPVLENLDWHHRDAQPNASAKARHDVPDSLLYPDATAKSVAAVLDPWQRFAHGSCVVEAKRWERALDREDKARKAEPGTPSSQMLRYLRRADDVTHGKLRWGILTNGRIWRLYHQGALSVAEDFLEIDLGKVFDLPGCGLDLLDKRPDAFIDDTAWRAHILRLFVLLFGRGAFLPVDGETFHQLALRQGKRWETKVARTLSDTVFNTVFPALADALVKDDPERPASIAAAYLAEVRQGALILLYRLLFVLYAEDRNLLPDESGPYAPYCLTRMRVEIADRHASGAAFPSTFATFWPRLTAIFRAIATGDDDLGIPPYNGGLFDPATAPILGRVTLPDSVMARVIFGLSHAETEVGTAGPKYINYRDLSVQQLGSVYERILEFGLRIARSGAVEVDADKAARHTSGSYYTPEDLVSLVIHRTVGPLVAERRAWFREEALSLERDGRATAMRLVDLGSRDPATAILSLKICDPAMGSGHFLVSLVDWLADEVLSAMAEATALVDWETYVSPLAGRIAAVRARVLAEAELHRWPIDENQLDDRHIVRRMVLKRVVYGIDKNPMAVELAKVALWLHSFTVGAPLSFLDHHLRAGDSVVGAAVRPTVEALQKRGALFNMGQVAAVERVAGFMTEIEETTDNDVAEVAASKAKFGAVADVIGPVAALFSLLTAERMMGVFDAAPRIAPDLRKLAGRSDRQIAKANADLIAFDRAAALQLVLEGTFGDPIRIADGKERVAPEPLPGQSALLPDVSPEQSALFPALSVDDRRRAIADRVVAEARALAERHGFFHWEVGFPNVWSNLGSTEPTGGFDAVIGNPPYVRQELLGDGVKRALRSTYASYDGAADLYVYFYEQGLRLLRPGGRMGYVVTNKWLKAGYAEGLRDLFATRGWLDFVADFGHARHFFPDADVFPSVVVVRRPDPAVAPPADAEICVIPRDLVPQKGLLGAVAEASFPLPRAVFTRDAWVLEPKPVLDLLDKIRRNGVPLADYASVKPLYGIKTGLNEAFLIDTAKRDELVRADPACADVIRPYLRGQDIQRWWSPDSGVHMIVLKSSGNQTWPWANASDDRSAERIFALTYPSLYLHLKNFESQPDPKTGKMVGLRHREDQGRFWWELRSCDYYSLFQKPKIVYVDIAWSSSFSIDRSGSFINNTAYFLPTGDYWIMNTLNAPIGWYYAWRRAQHGKDEALRYFTDFVEGYPIPIAVDLKKVVRIADQIEARKLLESQAVRAVRDWLRHEFGLQKTGEVLARPHTLDADEFTTAVRKALPRSRKLSAAEVGRLKAEHAETIAPARLAASEVAVLERRLSDLVNSAYGLTPEDVALMWATAPPRMPIPAPSKP